jgi:FMN-dependent NADH-azoreductase
MIASVTFVNEPIMKILHVSCSPRGPAAESFQLSTRIIGHLLKQAPTATVISRDIGGGILTPIDPDYALSQHSDADISQQGSAALSEELIGEVQSADCVVIATPMHNYSVPSALKLWIDHIVRVRWTFNVTPAGKRPLLHDRPIFIAISSGGRFSGEGARQPDFLTPYLKAILGMIGLHNLTFFSVQGTAFGAEAVAAARARANSDLREHFAS